VKSELHALFPHYWIYVSTAISNGATNQDERGRQYRFTTLTTLDPHYFPSAAHLSLHPGSFKCPQKGGARKPPTAGRLVAITTKTKNGGKLHVINLYQSTVNDEGQQDVIWGLINSWISRHPGERVILIGDMNGSIPGGLHNYAHPMEKNLVEADVRLAKFCADSKGTLSSPTEHTWKRGDKCAKLDHVISWNFHLASPRAVSNDVAHQRFDHAILSFSLPAEEFSKKPQPARRQLAPTDRIDAVFFQNHLRASRSCLSIFIFGETNKQFRGRVKTVYGKTSKIREKVLSWNPRQGNQNAYKTQTYYWISSKLTPADASYPCAFCI